VDYLGKYLRWPGGVIQENSKGRCYEVRA